MNYIQKKTETKNKPKPYFDLEPETGKYHWNPNRNLNFKKTV